jgi:hypothetical protein
VLVEQVVPDASPQSGFAVDDVVLVELRSPGPLAGFGFGVVCSTFLVGSPLLPLPLQELVHNSKTTTTTAIASSTRAPTMKRITTLLRLDMPDGLALKASMSSSSSSSSAPGHPKPDDEIGLRRLPLRQQLLGLGDQPEL